MRRTGKFSFVVACTAAFSMLFGGYALADVADNDVDATGVKTISSGSSTAIVYSLTAENSDGGPNGQGNCNASTTSPVTLRIDLPSGNKVSAKNSAGNDIDRLTFTDCGNNSRQTVNFSSSHAGAHLISHRVSGGTGTTTSSANFTLNVTAAPDTTPPVITKTINGTVGSNDWYPSDVTVAWTVKDDESAVTINSGCGTQTFSTETATGTSSCSASSTGGTSTASASFKIDKSAPTAVAMAPSGTAGQNGWYTSTVDVTTSGTDALSGVTCTASQSFSSETSGQNVTGSCTNGAGLTTAVAPMTLKIDKTGPSSDLAVTSGTEGADGWYISDVTVGATGSDTISAPVTCSPSSQTLTSNTTGTALNATCTNAAGISTGASPLTIKIDKTDPTAALSVAGGTLAADGWYVDNVTIRTAGSDVESGIDDCTDDQYLMTNTSSAGQAFNGSCTDNAGRTQNAESLTIKRDASAPTAELVVTDGTPGTNGWYTSDVTIEAQGTDGDSGVQCSAATTLSAETNGTVVTGYCVNGAGHRTNAEPKTIKIDKTGPSADLAASGRQGANRWFVGDVTVSTSGSDALSGGVTCTADQSQTAETAGQVFNGSCTNGAGLTTHAAALTVKLDKSGPTAVAGITNSPQEGSNGWFTSDIQAATTGSDSISSPVTCTKAVVSQTQETARTDLAGACTNDAGLTTDASALVVKLDKTAPTAAIAATGTVGDEQWFVSDVAVKTTGADDTSGVASCTGDQSQTTDTVGTTFTGSCTNNAGLTSIIDSVTVKRDVTDAVIEDDGATTDPNTNGWYNTAVTNVFSATDATSGLADGTSPISTSSATQQGRQVTLHSGGVSDLAGNIADSISSSAFKIDLDAPTVDAGVVTAGTAGDHGWYISGVTVDYTATDNLSGFGHDESLTTAASAQSSGEGDNVTVDSPAFTDNADNTVAAGNRSRSFMIDQTAPAVAYTSATAGSGNGPSTTGWYNAPVTATFTGTDTMSGFGESGADTDTKTASSHAGVEGAAVRIQSPAFNDYAGNTTAANAARESFKIDLTTPTNVAFTGNGVTDGGSYYFGQVPAAPTGCAANDALSGVKACLVTGNYSTRVGTHTLTATATDNAGNTASSTLTYTVRAWTAKGFYSPINMSSSTSKVWNTSKGGSTIPVTFELFAGSTELTDPAIADMSYRKVSCQTGAAADEIETTLTSTNQLGLRYDSTAGQFIYNWKSPTANGVTCYELKASFDDGGALTALFSLR